eukprot:CAMPEP_0178456912 /NCGR_PEP_ID=MMETSP0689_2-20121128/46738_1 /TAXON_ID=160604 /ORGANISM="Amphidinium massartii, Strain CS-259" /LENGTH=460 /DNA_ID=CAMNT_0020083131 /DNA_START=322 /DNA_END=1702 /DNA_ORIENTATION=+
MANAESFGTSHARTVQVNRSGTLLPAYAFLMKNRKDTVGFAYFPAIETLQEMMLHQGFAMDVRYLEDQFQLYGGSPASSEAERIYFIWFTRDLEKLPWEMHPAHALAGLGAYTILYQTEPWFPILKKSYDAAVALGAREIWDYSYENLQHYDVPAGSPIIFRYMPPGCAKAMDYAVNFSAAVRDEGHLAFLGTWANREPSVKIEYNLSGKLIPQGWGFAIHTEALFRNYFERFPIQLNTHSRLNDMRTFESFRASVMLANGACVLSETSGSLDEEAFEGIVAFGSGANLTLKFNALRGNSSAIRECQEQSRRLFCQRFNPVQLVYKSGFVTVLEQLEEYMPPQNLRTGSQAWLVCEAALPILEFISHIVGVEIATPLPDGDCNVRNATPLTRLTWRQIPELCLQAQRMIPPSGIMVAKACEKQIQITVHQGHLQAWLLRNVAAGRLFEYVTSFKALELMR